MQKKTFRLELDIDDKTGQLRSVYDSKADRKVISFNSGHEVEMNNARVSTEVIEHKDHWGALMTRFDIKCWEGYLTGARYELRRTIVPGGEGNHIGSDSAIHFRHSLRRTPWAGWEKPLDNLWQSPIEAPDLIKSLTVMCAPTDFFGPETRMRAIAIGGSGPREHVSLEDGLIEEVLPYMQTSFRTTFPGQSTVPGALYYHPGDERWMWIVVRHPDMGGEVQYREDGQGFKFLPYKNMNVHDRFVLPDISIYYGQGMDEADKCMASFFDLYEEPPAWWYNTSWFWLHTFWQPNASFEKALKAVELMMDECGVTGFGLSLHDLPTGEADCAARSLKASPLLGGDDKAKRLLDTIQERGGHTYVWMGRYGKLGQGGPMQYRDEWSYQGIDGRPIGDDIFRICDSLNPEYQEFRYKWVDYYVNYLGVDGIFWDSAFQPVPPNFSEASNEWLNFPGEAMAGPVALYEEIYRLGKSMNEDFFMWGEGISTERMTNAFAVDNSTHGEMSGHELMRRLAHAGERRLVWRSCWGQDVTGAFPFVKPSQDICRSFESDFYKDLVADPMNKWICQTVKERGCRQSVGVADGIAVLDEFLVVPTYDKLLGKVVVPNELVRGQSLVNELSGARCEGTPVDGGVSFDLQETGPWKMV